MSTMQVDQSRIRNFCIIAHPAFAKATADFARSRSIYKGSHLCK